MHPGWLAANMSGIVEQYWSAAADLEAGELDVLLTSAAIQCEAFAPEVTSDTPLPDSYLHAQVLQARALHRAGIAGRDGEMGVLDGMSVTVFPMDWTVKNLLRPKGRLWVK